MAFVRRIGGGYYGIETEGIGEVSQDVWKRINDAFKDTVITTGERKSVPLPSKGSTARRPLPRLRSK